MNLKVFFGMLLMIVGGLVALGAGGCTVIFAGSEIWSLLERGRMERAGDMLVTASLVGGIPFLIGLGLFRLGRSLSRAPRSLQAPMPSSMSSSAGIGLGGHLGYAFREMRDEFAAFMPGVVRKEGRASSADDDADKPPKDEAK